MEQKVNQMGTRAVFPLLMTMALPPMVSMMIQSMYNIVDSIFVAKIGQDALTAVSLAFPLQNMILAVAVGLGIGLSAGVAKSLGGKKLEEANAIARHSMLLAGFHSLLFVLIGIFLTKPFLAMFVNDEQIFQWSYDYAFIVTCFSFGGIFHITIEKIFQATGNMVIPMVLQAIGAVVNIILDPILIFGYFGFPKMDVQGAAIATVLAQMTSCILSILFLKYYNKTITIKWKGFQWNWQIVKQLYCIAIPSGIMMALPSALVGLLNGILVSVSQVAVAVFGLYFKIQTFVYMPASGVIQGMRPIISFNYGAEMYDRLFETVKVSLLVIGCIMLFGTLLFMIFPIQIMLLFEANEEMMQTGIMALRIISIGFIISTVGVVLSGVFESLGKGFHSLIVSLLRQFLIIPPLSFLFVGQMGLTGVWITFPIAELIATIVAICLFLNVKKKLCHSLAE